MNDALSKAQEIYDNMAEEFGPMIDDNRFTGEIRSESPDVLFDYEYGRIVAVSQLDDDGEALYQGLLAGWRFSGKEDLVIAADRAAFTAWLEGADYATI
jgi:hypothetical protein